MSEFRNIPLSQIDPSSSPIRDIDPDALSDLTDSVATRGILQPILVRPQDDRFEVVFGNHRYYAAKRAGLPEIPCLVRTLDDVESIFLSLSENIQRADMNPVKEGEAYKKLLKNYPIKELSERLGKSVSYIQGRIKISDGLHPDLIKEIGCELTIGSAIQLSGLPRAKQLEVFDQIKKYKDNPGGGSGFGGMGVYPGNDPNYCTCPKCGVKHPRGEP